MRRSTCFLLAFSCVLGCHSLDRDNPVDPAGEPAVEPGVIAGADGASLSLVVPLPKALATIVDSLVARLSGPDVPTIIKSLDYPSPLGPATLTIGAISPGSGRTLTIEGYDLTGRLILAGERGDITVVTGDTTRVTIDLRLTIDPTTLDKPDTTTGAAQDTTTAAAAESTATAGTDGEPPAEG
ncbi:MAG: hypothetical protein O2782_02605 [bacterium]|nr:hypothetical protein [bacterium]